MSFTFGFYDSIDHDRLYNAEQFAAMFDGVINDGVFEHVGDKFIVKPLTGMQITVGSGRAWFDRTWNYNDTELPLIVEASDLMLNRYDAVVIETDHTTSARLNQIKIIKGELATNPVKPTLTNNYLVGQHALAYIYVRKGTSVISAADIENVVGRTGCPFVTSILEVTNIDDLWDQWRGQWNRWYENETTTDEADWDQWWETKQQEFIDWFSTIRDLFKDTAAETLEAMSTKITSLQISAKYTLYANQWVTGTEQTFPLRQSLNIASITASSEPIIEFGPPATQNAANFQSLKKAIGALDKYVTEAGKITFYCYSKTPLVDIPIRLRGI